MHFTKISGFLNTSGATVGAGVGHGDKGRKGVVLERKGLHGPMLENKRHD